MIETIDEIVEALGGTVATGKICGLGAPAVSGWKTRQRIPPEHYFALCEALEVAGKPMPSRDLFEFSKPTIAAE